MTSHAAFMSAFKSVRFVVCSSASRSARVEGRVMAETHDDRFRRFGRQAVVLGVVAYLFWARAHRPFSTPVLFGFALCVLGSLTCIILSAGSYGLDLLEKRKK